MGGRGKKREQVLGIRSRVGGLQRSTSEGSVSAKNFEEPLGPYGCNPRGMIGRKVKKYLSQVELITRNGLERMKVHKHQGKRRCISFGERFCQPNKESATTRCCE